MKYNHTTVPAPMFNEHTMFEDPKNFMRNVLEQKKIIVEVASNTKTTLRINFRLGQFCNGVNLKVTELKYHSPKPEWNYFSGEQVESHYLKVSKTQGFESIKQHCEGVFEKYFPTLFKEMGELTFEYHLTRKLQEVIEKDLPKA